MKLNGVGRYRDGGSLGASYESNGEPKELVFQIKHDVVDGKCINERFLPRLYDNNINSRKYDDILWESALIILNQLDIEDIKDHEWAKSFIVNYDLMVEMANKNTKDV